MQHNDNTIKKMNIPTNLSLNNTETEGTEQPFDPEEILKSVEVDPYADIEKPPTAIEIHGANISPSFTLGNFSMLIGKAKSKKTFLLTGLAAATASNGWALGCIKGVLPFDKRAVLYFDTEQSEYHLNRTIKRVLRQANDLSNFRAFGLRKYKPAERLKLIDFAVNNTPGVGIVFIDGIRDLLTKGINDEEEATSLTSTFLRWTAERNIHLVTVLHQNKTDVNARGVIGTECLNKAETTLSVTIDDFDKDVSIVSCEMSRDLPFADFAFRINEEGLPEPCDLPENPNARPKAVNPDQLTDEEHFKTLGEVFKATPAPKYRELWQAIKVVFGASQVRIGDNRAKDFLAYYQQMNWITKDGMKYKYNRAIF